MFHRKRTIALASSVLGLALFALPFEAGPALSLSGLDLVRGALSGGTWSGARIALALLLVSLILALAWSIRGIFSRQDRDANGHSA